jgi:hypothetical protein
MKQQQQQQHKTMRLNARLAAWGLGCALLAASTGAWAQAEASSPAKKELVAKILKLQQPVIEGLAQGLAEQPAAQLMQQAGIALQSQVSMDKREEIGNGIKADVKAYLDETAPLLKDKAVKLAPGTVGALLEEKFTEDELRQLIAILESPINRRLQELGGDMQRVLRDKLISEARPEVEPKVRALQQNMAKRLGANASPAPAAASAPPAAASKPRPPAKPASAAK